MADSTISYYALMGDTGSREVTSLLAALFAGRGPAQGVVWNIPGQQWRFSPEATAFYLYDPENSEMSYAIDRSSAEQMARQILHSELPSEEELRRTCAEGLDVWLAEEEALENEDEEDLENEVFDDEDEPSGPAQK